MRRIIPGLIKTNEHCIGCNRCIASCPVPGANISFLRGGVAHFKVDGTTCINCGHCMTACNHSARDYTDDTDRFFEDLKGGQKINLIVAPSFYVQYPDAAPHILGYLRSQGVAEIYDADLGMAIATWCHLKLIEEKQRNGEAFDHPIAHICPSVTHYIEHRDPEHLDHMIPIHSPLMCTAIYIQRYLHDDRPLAILSPCIAEKDEIDSVRSGGYVSYSITFQHLMKRFTSADLSVFHAESATPPVDYRALLPRTDSLKTSIEWFLPPDDLVVRLTGMASTPESVPAIARDLTEQGVDPLLVEVYSCDYGCVTGPGSEHPRRNFAQELLDHRDNRKDMEDTDVSYDERRAKLDRLFANLDPEDFSRMFSEHFKQPCTVPDDIIDEVFESMYKRTPDSRTIDCGSCGYSSCHEMVEAIANGFNHRENCVYFSKEEMARLYQSDTLTGLSNEAAFKQQTAALLEANPETEYLIGLLDVRSFKVINDLLGFDEGDRTLRFLASRLKHYLSGSGTYARLHSDSFGFCLPYTPQVVESVLENSRREAESFDLDFPLRLKFGFCVVQDRSIPIDRLMDFARIALSTVKNDFLRRYAFYSDEMRNTMLKEAAIASEMREALAKRQFVVFLQPQYNHATESLVGAEALVRWIHPERGFISPGDFIPVFEKNGFITQLDRYIWEETCKQLRAWIDDGVDVVPVSVNLSRLDIYDPDLTTTLKGLVEKYRLPDGMLKLEITESAYVESPDQLISTVRELQELGFIIEMDDFGSGYSSLNTLKDVPVDILKIDLKFLAGDNAGRGGNILQSIIRMARWLQLPVIAEGVEDIHQADYLKSIGCDVVQGYYYSRPIPTDQFESMLREIPSSDMLHEGAMESVIDLDEFWNHESQLAHFFDKVLDSSIIFEYRAGRIEALRMNDAFYDTTQLTRERFERLSLDIMGLIYPADRQKILKALDKAAETDRIVVCQARWGTDDGLSKPLVLQLRIRRLVHSDDRSVFCATVETL